MKYTQKQLLKETPVEAILAVFTWLSHVLCEEGPDAAALYHADIALRRMESIALAVACLEWKFDAKLRKQLALPTEAYMRAVKRIFPSDVVTKEVFALTVGCWIERRSSKAAE